MCKVSVLMSVFNENEKELDEAVFSIINQTFKDFEFIIVNDNPKNTDLAKKLDDFKILDKRIVIIKNEKNIGLAMSINKASQLAKGKYIARMDADDIATTDRLEKEYNIIKKGTVDLVCSNFYFIDEESRLLSRKFDFLTKKQLIKLLPVWNTVHHPTIMMKREVFLKLGGFRDFPCAQDYDLWLRMLSEKYTFLMLEEKLLKYRIRSNSTTSSKRLLQVLTMNYAKKLYKERKIDGEDHYSPLDYENFLKNNGYYDERYCNEIEKKD